MVSASASDREVPVERPRGHQEIVQAVVESATQLFSRRGPAVVSLREVAAGAGVTLSQIHRHIGNKEDLLRAVLAADLDRSARLPEPGQLELAAFLSALFQVSDATIRTRLQARVILDGYDLPALQNRYPGIELALQLLAEQLPEDQARVRAALLASFFAGWQLLGPTYLRVAGAPALTQPELAHHIGPVLEALAGAPASPDPTP